MGKRFIKRFTAALLLAAMFMSAFTINPAEAASYTFNTDTLKDGKTVSGKQAVYSSGNYTYYIFKITVPEDGYITITDESDSKGWIRLYACSLDEIKDIISNYKSGGYLMYTRSNVEKTSVPLEKGEYYITPDSGEFKFNYKFTKADTDYDNYIALKAKTLKSGTAFTVCQPVGYDAELYFKFTVTKKKTVTITFNSMFGDARFAIFDSYGTKYDVVDASDNKYKTAKQLPKGTYYIKTGNSSMYNLTDAKLYKISWK